MRDRRVDSPGPDHAGRLPGAHLLAGLSTKLAALWPRHRPSLRDDEYDGPATCTSVS